MNQTQKRHLRQLAHHLKPVIIIGQSGLSPALLSELDAALEHHELIKVRVNGADRGQRQALTEQMCAHSGARLVQSIGHVAVLYRPAEKPRLQLP